MRRKWLRLPCLSFALMLPGLLAAEPEVPHLNALPPPSPPNVATVCSAPRLVFYPFMEKYFKYIVEASVVSEPVQDHESVRAWIFIDRFISGKFKPNKVQILFLNQCGPGGSVFRKGDRLRIYITLSTYPQFGTSGSGEYWNNITPQ